MGDKGNALAERPGEAVNGAAPFFYQCARYPGDYWALSGALDALRRHWLRGVLQPADRDRLAGMIAAARATTEEAKERGNLVRGLHPYVAKRGFDALEFLTFAWSNPDWPRGAPSKQNPRTANALRAARIMQNDAHNLVLEDDIAETRIGRLAAKGGLPY